VEHESEGKYHRARHGVPIGAKELTYHVVTLRAKYRNKVHAHVECQEQYQKAARNAHYQLLSDRTFKKSFHSRLFVVFILIIYNVNFKLQS
jgi:hypothetical protein